MKKILFLSMLLPSLMFGQTSRWRTNPPTQNNPQVPQTPQIPQNPIPHHQIQVLGEITHRHHQEHLKETITTPIHNTIVTTDTIPILHTDTIDGILGGHLIMDMITTPTGITSTGGGIENLTECMFMIMERKTL